MAPPAMDVMKDEAWRKAVLDQFQDVRVALEDGYVNLGTFLLFISLSIATLAWTVDTEFRRSRARFATIDAKIVSATGRVQDEVIEALKSPRIEVMKPGIPLRELRHRIEAAQTRIFLMYFKVDPSTDGETMKYWHSVTKSFVAKRSQQVQIRRLVSIDSLDKLNFLLANNNLLFTFLKGVKENVAGVDYKLIALPHVDAKPPQLDIVDDAAFWFSTYGGRGGNAPTSTHLVADPQVVDMYAAYYESLVAGLPPHSVLLSTSFKSISMEKGKDGDEVGWRYSEDEVENILTALAGCARPPKELPRDTTVKLLADHLPAKYSEGGKDAGYELNARYFALLDARKA
jgi:hypothetical protein